MPDPQVRTWEFFSMPPFAHLPAGSSWLILSHL
jgi:hypothetical protein